MLAAGRMANRLDHPVVLDPVGVGASRLRRDAARRLLEEVHFTVIRGNATEIRTLASGAAAHRGVDADGDVGSDANSLDEIAGKLARMHGAAVIATGSTDMVTDGKTTWRVLNGHPMMRMVTGSGCQLSALVGACLAANPGAPLEAALTAACAMGLCGEIAHARLAPQDGNATYRNYMIDAMCRLSPEALEEGARYEAY